MSDLDDLLEDELMATAYQASAQLIARTPDVVALAQPNSDTANATRLAQLGQGAHRYDLERGRWLYWDGSRWAEDVGAYHLLQRVRQVPTVVAAEAEDADEARRTTLLKWAVASSNARAAQAMVQVARSDPGLVIHPGTLDNEPMLFNVRNGTLDLSTGRLLRPQPGHYLTMRSEVAYDAEAECPAWLDFLETTFQGDQQLIRWLQKFLGYCLTGEVDEQVFTFWFGTGANGKSTLLEVVRFILGDYARHTAAETLLDVRRGGAREDLARLPGARLVTASELRAGQRWDEATLKSLTGGDPITARALYQPSFEFYPRFKLVVLANHKPAVRDQTEAFWRRLRLVPFKYTVPEAQRDPDLAIRLREEAPGILRWMVVGCLAWQRERLGTTPAILEQTAEYRQGEDVVRQFLAEECLTGPEAAGQRTMASALYARFRQWTQERGERTPSQKVFGEELRRAGISAGLHNGRTAYRDITLRPEIRLSV